MLQYILTHSVKFTCVQLEVLCKFSSPCDISSWWIYYLKSSPYRRLDCGPFLLTQVWTQSQRARSVLALICLIACSSPSCLTLFLFQTFMCKSNALIFHNTSASKKPRLLQIHRPLWSTCGFFKSSSPPGFLFSFPGLDNGPEYRPSPPKNHPGVQFVWITQCVDKWSAQTPGTSGLRIQVISFSIKVA